MTRRGAGSASGAAAAPLAAALHNEDVAAAFDEMSELLAIGGANPFRIRAYERAARTIRSEPRPLAELRAAGELAELPGIGADLAGKIEALLDTGHCAALEELRKEVPAGLRELLRIPALGPVRVHALHAKRGIDSCEDLRKALAAGRLAGLRGFGPVLQKRLQQALATRVEAPSRWLHPIAAEYAEPLRAHLASLPGVARAEIAGSYRRGRETVGDLDLVVCARAGFDLAAALKAWPDVRELLASGPTRCTVVLRNGMHADLRLVPEDSFGSALLYFTGSREHNLRMRRRAQERGLKLNEYGLFRGRKRLAGASEKEVLAALGLPPIPPELREDRGEIAAAEAHALPELVQLADLRGDLHAHTLASDGRDSLRDMVEAARARGLRYLAVTDHSRHLGIVHGLDASRLLRQMASIDALNERLHDFVVLKGAEVDILEDGSLALPDSILRRLDVVVVAIHSHFGLGAAKQTARVLRALDHPCVSILAHPTARLIGERPPCELDFTRILAAARARPCYLELNSQPARLDLDDRLCQAARDHGVLVSLSSDAHSTAELADLACGVRQARRGWLTAADVINTRSVAGVRRLLARTRV